MSWQRGVEVLKKIVEGRKAIGHLESPNALINEETDSLADLIAGLEAHEKFRRAVWQDGLIKAPAWEHGLEALEQNLTKVRALTEGFPIDRPTLDNFDALVYEVKRVKGLLPPLLGVAPEGGDMMKILQAQTAVLVAATIDRVLAAWTAPTGIEHEPECAAHHDQCLCCLDADHAMYARLRTRLVDALTTAFLATPKENEAACTR